MQQERRTQTQMNTRKEFINGYSVSSVQYYAVYLSFLSTGLINKKL